MIGHTEPLRCRASPSTARLRRRKPCAPPFAGAIQPCQAASANKELTHGLWMWRKRICTKKIGAAALAAADRSAGTPGRRAAAQRDNGAGPVHGTRACGALNGLSCPKGERRSGAEDGVNVFMRECARLDCCIVEESPATRTCMGWSPSFDKNGNLLGPGDPNVTTYYFRCSTCGAQWMEREQYGFAEVRYQ